MLALLIFFLGGQRAFMNRPLATAHTAIERQCESCHVPFAGSANARCIACHAEAVVKRDHAQLTNQCAECHREHQGPAHILVSASEEGCLVCHRAVLGEGKHPPAALGQCLLCHAHHADQLFARQVVTDLVFPHRVHVEAGGLVQAPCESCHALAPEGFLRGLPREPTCGGCHFDYVHDTKKDARSAECRLCHDPDNRVKIARAPGHASLRFAHGDHLGFACSECHREVELSATTAVPLPTAESCTRCHDRRMARGR